MNDRLPRAGRRERERLAVERRALRSRPPRTVEARRAARRRASCRSSPRRPACSARRRRRRRWRSARRVPRPASGSWPHPTAVRMLRGMRRCDTAAVLWETGAPLSVEEVELGEPQAGEVRVRIAAAGVCRSDLHVMDGTWTYDLPMVLGHEGAGIVEAVGPGVLAPQGRRRRRALVGDRVRPLSRLRLGLAGAVRDRLAPAPHARRQLAAAGARPGSRSLHGDRVLRRARVVPATQAVELPEGADLEVAALIGCAAMTGVGAVFNDRRRAARRARRGVRLRRRRPVHRPGPAGGRRVPDRRGRRDRGGARARARLGCHGHRAGRLR